MFDFSIFPEDTVKSTAAAYPCSVCPELCAPPPWDPSDPATWPQV